MGGGERELDVRIDSKPVVIKPIPKKRSERSHYLLGIPTSFTGRAVADARRAGVPVNVCQFTCQLHCTIKIGQRGTYSLEASQAVKREAQRVAENENGTSTSIFVSVCAREARLCSCSLSLSLEALFLMKARSYIAVCVQFVLLLLNEY